MTNGLELGPAQFRVADDGPLAAVLRGYRTAQEGSVRSGLAIVEAALPALEKVADSDAAALGWLAAAEVARRASQWRKAAARAFRAARVAASSAPFAAGVAVAAGAQALILGPGVAAATDELRRLQDELKPLDLAVAWASVESAAGQTQSARARLRSLGPATATATGWGERWLRLLELETFLELGALAGATQVSVALHGRLTDAERFSEQHLRLLALEIWLDIERVLATPTHEAPAVAPDVLVQRSRRLSRASAAFPLYASWADQLTGEALLLAGHSAEQAFGHAIEAARALRSPYLEGAFLTRQASRPRQVTERTASGPARTARKLLAEVGASARAEGAMPHAEVGRASQLTRKSMAARLNDLAPSEEATLEAVTELSRHLNTIRDVEVLLARVLDSVVRLLRAERAALLAVDETGAKRCVAAHGIPIDEVTSERAGISRGVLAETETSGEPLRADNAQADQRFRDRASVQVGEIRSVMCAPVRTPTRVLGYIYLDRRVISSAFTDEHLDLLGLFAVHAAVAWENALSYGALQHVNEALEGKVRDRTVELRDSNRKLEEYIHELTHTRLRLAEVERDAMQKELSLAREIQRSILPPETEVTTSGVTVAGIVVPASYCGGDFWTVRELPGGKTLVFIGDVTGHGVAAALFTAVLRASIDSLEHTGVLSVPTELMRHLNAALYKTGQTNMCASAIACLYDPDQGLEVVTAGHPPALLVGQDRTIRVSASGGAALGRDPEPNVVVSKFERSAGSTLLLYTDGITEWETGEKRAYGMRRLRNALTAAASHAPKGVVDAVLADARTFAQGAECTDDITLIAVRTA